MVYAFSLSFFQVFGYAAYVHELRFLRVTSSEFGKDSYITGLGGIDENLLGSPSWMSYAEAKEFIKQFGAGSLYVQEEAKAH